MDLNTYVEKNKMLETLQKHGNTDEVSGGAATVPHWHEYIMNEFGQGYTLGAMGGVSHEHMIVNGECLQCQGHTHKLLEPTLIDDDSFVKGMGNGCNCQ